MTVISSALLFLASAQVAVPPSQCELHVWPTRNYHANFHGAAPVYGGIQMYLSPMEQAKAAMRSILSEDAQSKLIAQQTPSAGSSLFGYKVVLHEAPEQSRFANWLDKHVGDGPRATDSNSSCYAELHLVGLTIYKTVLYKELQTIYVFRAFNSGPNAIKTVRDATRARPGTIKTSRQLQTSEAEVELRNAFAHSVSKIFENRKLALKR